MKLYICIIGLFLSPWAMASPGYTQKGDTVIIKIGSNSQLLIVTENKEEIEKLSEYDLNAIIQDLEITMKGDSGTFYIEMKDLSGKKYLKEDANNSEEENDENLTFEERMERFEHRMRKFEDKMDDMDTNSDHPSYHYDSHSDFDRQEAVHFNENGTSYSLNIDLGINNYLENGKFPDDNNAMYAVKPLGSWNIALNWVNKNRIAGPLYLQWGPGLSWYNFKFDDNDVRLTKTDNAVEFYRVGPEVNSIKSKLVTSYINFNLVPMLDFGKRRDSDRFTFMEKSSDSFRIGFGGYAGYRIGSHSKFVYKDDGDREREKDRKNFYLNNWRYGLRFQMGYRGVDFFANYDLNELFVTGKGPQLNAFSFGIVL